MHRKKLRSSEYAEALAPGYPKWLMASWGALLYPWLIKHLSPAASSENLRRQSAFLLTFKTLCRNLIFTFLILHFSHFQHFLVTVLPSNSLHFLPQLILANNFFHVDMEDLLFCLCRQLMKTIWKWKMAGCPFTLIINMTMSYLSLFCPQLVLHSALASNCSALASYFKSHAKTGFTISSWF